MDNIMTETEIQETINNTMRCLAYQIFWKKGDYKFVAAYEKLKSRVYLDWDFNINERLKSSPDENITLFDVLHKDELKLVLQSSKNLLKLYEGVLDKQAS